MRCAWVSRGLQVSCESEVWVSVDWNYNSGMEKGMIWLIL